MYVYGSVVPSAQKSVTCIVSLNFEIFLCICLKDTKWIIMVAFTIKILRKVYSCLPQNDALEALEILQILKLNVYRKYFEKQKCI